jgi:four helix bundle protein
LPHSGHNSKGKRFAFWRLHDAFGQPCQDPRASEALFQLLKAATSSTFNLAEADAASSDADFVAKMRIALREAKEAP